MSPARRKSFLALSVVANLSFLGVFKYANFFADNLQTLLGLFGLDVSIATLNVVLPVGISFYTFQTMSYTIDIYAGTLSPISSFADFALYVSFFPQLVAGPIERAARLIPQIVRPRTITPEMISDGAHLFFIGFFMKVFVADNLAVVADRIFAAKSGFSAAQVLIGGYSFAFEIYGDFAGYTYMARGIAKLMGFDLMLNFRNPYLATDPSDFWKRWHISLSSWLRDYLYISLGGNRKGKIRQYANLIITMFLGGLWHGASWNMVIWGAMNGLGLVVHKYWRRISPWKAITSWPIHAMSVLITLLFITLTRTWFRGENLESANLMLHRIVYRFQAELIPEVVTGYITVFSFILGGYIIHWLPSHWKAYYRLRFAHAPLFVQAFVTFLAIVLIFQVMSAELQPFIYFVF